MNLEESNQIFKENKRKNAKKKSIIVGIILCIIIIALCLGIIFILQQKEATRFRFMVDGIETQMSENFITVDENGNKYVNLKLLAGYTGYKYTKGDYIEVNEDINSCYIKNNYEVVSFTVGQDYFSKYAQNEFVNTSVEENEITNQNNYIVKSKHNEKEVFKTDLPAILLNEEIYVPLEKVDLICNASISVEEKGIEIYSLDYLVSYAQQLAANYGYKSLSSTYENIKTIPNNMIVVGDGSNYGVINFSDGKEILGLKYDDLKYIQNENKFYIYVDSKVGLIDANGKTIISPKEYDSIETFDVDKNLYLVKEDGKYGLLNLQGNPILHTDYEQIGISNIRDFNLKKLANENLWFDSIIAIKRGSLYGLYNVDTKEEILEINYDSFGYKTQSTDTLGEESVLLIPKETGVEGIVIVLDGKYGIYDINEEKEVIPCACDRIYSISNNGVTTYYMEFGGHQLEMREYFEGHDLVSVELDEEEDEEEPENTAE